MDTYTLLFAIVWIVCALLVGRIAYLRGIAAWQGFALGLLLSPFVGLLLVLATRTKVTA